MKQKSLTPNNTYILYLEKGEKINESIEDFCIVHNIKSASFSAIGAVCNVNVAQFQIEEKTYLHKHFIETQELTNLTGNLAFIKNNANKDRWFAHTHVTLSNEKAECFGGHLIEAEVAAVVEVILIEYEEPLFRKYNENIGLNVIEL